MKVDADEKLLSEVITRLLRNKKILAQANKRAQRKALCLASELEAEGEDVNAQSLDCPAASIGVAYSPMMWSTLGGIDNAVATLTITSPSGASSASSNNIGAISSL